MSQNEALRLLATLDRVWTSIRAEHKDVPQVLLLAAPSSRRHGPIGHFSALRWQHRTAGALHEVVLFAEYLHQEPTRVLEVLLHEAAHAANYAQGIKDCSASQYHNLSFKRTAEELGLLVQRYGHRGFADTKLRPETAVRFAVQLKLLGDEIKAYRRWSRDKAVGVKTPSRNLKASCRCGYLIRVARSTLAATEIRCGQCQQPFVCCD